MHSISKACAFPVAQQFIGATVVAISGFAIICEVAAFVFRAINAAAKNKSLEFEGQEKFYALKSSVERDAKDLAKGIFICIPLIATIYYAVKWSQQDQLKDHLMGDVKERFEDRKISQAVSNMSAIPVIQQIVGVVLLAYNCFKILTYDIPLVIFSAISLEIERRSWSNSYHPLDNYEGEEEVPEPAYRETEQILLLREAQLKKDALEACEDLLRCIPIISSIWYGLIWHYEKDKLSIMTSNLATAL